MVKRRKKTGFFAKKTVTMTALAALLAFYAQTVYAQSDSPTKKASAGRFITNVDRFVSVTDWADIPLQSWFSYVNLSHGQLGGNYNNSWEIGFAKTLKNIYLGTGFQGKFWSGKSGWGAITENNPTGGVTPQFSGPTVDLADPIDANGYLNVTGGSYTGVSNNGADNVFNLLIGFNNESRSAFKFKLTEKNTLNRIEGPVLITDSGNPAILPHKGYARQLNGTLTPSVEYGVSKEVEVGPFKSRPKAALDLAITFQESEVQDHDETVAAKFTKNVMKPLLTLDSGSTLIGNIPGIKFGISNKLEFEYKDAAYSGTADLPANAEAASQDGKVDKWKDVITPYARFTQVINAALTVKAALDVPLSIEQGGYFGIYDATQTSAATGFNPNASAYPRLRFGAQYAVQEGKLADKLLLNIGVTAYLPAYYYTDAQVDTAPDGTLVKVTENYEWTWQTRGTLQELGLGATFKFGDNAALDFWTTINLNYNQNSDGTRGLLNNQVWDSIFNWGGILFSLTY